MTHSSVSSPDALRETLREHYHRVRSESEALARPITPEDAQIQSMDDASPTKWHLGHTAWFFETFLLEGRPGFRPVREEFRVLFNSYYNAVGEKHPRARRGMLSRPSFDEVLDYRHAVDAGVKQFIEEAPGEELAEQAGVVRVGLHHEQQHQELLVTDILHVFWSNPLKPCYRDDELAKCETAAPLRWHRYPEGLHSMGFAGDGFAFDNEYPRHRVFVEDFELASRLVTAGEYMEFMAAGGYQRPDLWLADGWATVQREGWQAPMYWERRQGTWWQMTLYGLRPVDPNAPACHVSFYEADAYARWRGARLPTEAEWEIAAASLPVEGNLQESDFVAPRGVTGDAGARAPAQMFGDVWEWTGSAYLPYPGYRVSEGALGEYNGKFMCNQMVLRGGSFVTPRDHVRSTYRNFFYPHQRWQFMGIRLARDPQ